jgi:hypothetical protein
VYPWGLYGQPDDRCWTWRHVAGKNTAGNTVFLIKGYERWWAGLAVGKILLVPVGNLI